MHLITVGQVREVKGFLEGSLKAEGTSKDPELEKWKD
jgi:hypothetical protein